MSNLLGLAEQVLDEFEYRPGWHLTAKLYDDNQVWLFAHFQDYDSSAVELGPVDQMRMWPLDATIVSEEGMVYAVAHLLEGFARHESREFARWQGKLVHDPHACPDCLAGRCDW